MSVNEMRRKRRLIVIDPGIFNALPHPGARRQVEDGVKGRLVGKHGRQLGQTGDVDFLEVKARPALQALQAPALEAHIVGVVQVV
jgi:hypothetical protein